MIALVLVACSETPAPSPEDSSPGCGPVVGEPTELPSEGIHTYAPTLETLVAGTEGALVAYTEWTPPDETSDSGSAFGDPTCFATVVDPAGVPRGERTPIACGGATAVALGDGFLLAAGGEQWRFRTDGEAVPLAPAPDPAWLAAVNRGDGVRTFAIERTAATLELVTRDLSDDGTAVTISSVTISSAPTDDTAAISHDGTGGVVVMWHWRSPGASWSRMGADGALVGAWQPLDVLKGSVTSTRVDEGVHRMTFATTSSPPLVTELAFSADAVIGLSIQLSRYERVSLAPGGSLLGVDPDSGAFRIPLDGDAFGPRESLSMPIAPEEASEGPAGVFAVGANRARDLVVSTLDGPPSVVDPSVSIPRPQTRVGWQGGAAGTLVWWTEHQREPGSGLVGVWLDPSGAPQGSPALLWLSDTLQPTGVVTPAGAVWVSTQYGYPVLWSIGPDLGLDFLFIDGVSGPGAWLGDRAVLPLVGGGVQSVDESGTRLATAVVDDGSFTAAVAGDEPGELGLVVQQHAYDGPDATALSSLVLSTVDSELTLSPPTAEIPDALAVQDLWTCGPGCWVLGAYTLDDKGYATFEIHAAAGEAPVVEPSPLGPGGGLAGTCGFLLASGGELAWSPDLDASTPIEGPWSGSVLGVVPAPGGAVMLTLSDERIRTYPVAFAR